MTLSVSLSLSLTHTHALSLPHTHIHSHTHSHTHTHTPGLHHPVFLLNLVFRCLLPTPGDILCLSCQQSARPAVLTGDVPAWLSTLDMARHSLWIAWGEKTGPE